MAKTNILKESGFLDIRMICEEKNLYSNKKIRLSGLVFE